MELRNCGNTHFIHATRGGSVVKVCSRDSNGRPALSSNPLKDVYEGKDSKILQQHPKISSHNVQPGSVFDPEHVKCEVPCLPVVNRTLREIKPETDEFIQHFDNGPDSVLDDDTTLKQLKKRFVKKERKLSRSNENCEVSCLPVADSTLWEIKSEADEFVPHSDNVSDSVLDDDTTLRKLKKRFLAKRRKLSYSSEDSEVPCSPVVDSILGEIKPGPDEFVRHSDTALDGDLDDETTLGHLKERFLGKKRNFGCINENSNLACSKEKLEEAASKLKESTINRKLKNSRKSMAKSDIKSEPNLVSEWSPVVGGDIAPVIRVKVEAWDTEELGSQRRPTFSDDSSISHNEVPHPGGEASNGSQKMTVQLEHKESLLSAEECLNCVTNEISYDHLEDAEPTSVPVTSNNISVKLETLELHCHESLDLPPLETHKAKEISEEHSCGSSPSDDQNSDIFMLSRKFSSMEEASDQYSSSVAQTQVPDMATESTTGCMKLRPEVDVFEEKCKEDFPRGQGNSLGIPGKNHSSSQNFITSLNTDDNAVSIEDTKTDEEEPLTCTLDDIARSDLNCGSNMENELLKTGEKQASEYLITDAECQSSLKNQISNIADTFSVEDKLLKADGSTSLITDAEGQSSLKYQMFNSVDTISTPESLQPPERLLSTRKVISLSSQEQMCLAAVNSVELSHDVDKCRNGQLSQRKVIISSSSIVKKPRSVRVNIGKPRFTRTLPNLSTGNMSIQGFPESAVAFSQRQMRDIESLAVKMMKELKSMKDIVEKKLPFEAYHNAPSRSDADEVKSAVNSATKMEDTAQKWLSKMARDCNRFCKIMKLTPNDVTTPKNAVPREKRKIMFADEAGGKLCHVKFFEDGVTSAVSDGLRQ